MAKDLEEKMNAMAIVRLAKMSTRPEFYSGRGAISSDLNDKTLEKIYQIIEREHGKDAAENYVKMVAGMPKLSATDFLITLYRLDSNKWKWEERLSSKENGIYAGSPGSALGTIACVLAEDSKRDQTDYIRNEFLRRHGIEPKSKEQGRMDNEWHKSPDEMYGCYK